MDKDINSQPSHSAASHTQSPFDAHSLFEEARAQMRPADAPNSLQQGFMGLANEAASDIRDGARGLHKGFVDETKDVWEFLLTKEAVNKALLKLGPTLDTAANYYADKIGNARGTDIMQDVGIARGAMIDSVKDFVNKPAEGKGEVLGHAVVQGMVADLLSAPMQMIAPELRLGMNGDLAAKQPMAFPKGYKDYHELLEKRGATQFESLGPTFIAQNLTASPEFVVDLQRYIGRLPGDLKHILSSKGVEFKGVKAINDVVVNPIDNGRGLYRNDTKSIYVAENFKRLDYWITEATTEERVLRHEIGHALDDTGAAGYWLSDRPTFRRAWDKDMSQMSQGRRQYFDHYTSSDTGRREAFAEAYAILHTTEVAADKAWRMQFAKTFPNVMKQVEQGNWP